MFLTTRTSAKVDTRAARPNGVNQPRLLWCTFVIPRADPRLFLDRAAPSCPEFFPSHRKTMQGLASLCASL